MYIVKSANCYAFSESKENAVAFVNAPIVEENGEDILFEKCEEGYKSLGFSCTEKVNDEGRGLFSLERTLTNTGYTTRIVKFVFETVTAFAPARYIIPSVSYDGNKQGGGLEPKGMLHENGKPWIHSYDRTPIPSCSVTENKEIAFSLFADAMTPESQVSAVSLRPVGDEISQRIYWPQTEAPFTYYDNDVYNEPLHKYFTLKSGESHTVKVYMLLSTPRWENFGVCDTLDRALELFPFTHGKNRTVDDIWRLGIAYSRFLYREVGGKKLFADGCSERHPQGIVGYSKHTDIGWLGHNIMNARMHILEYLRTGDKQTLDDALGVLDAWAEKQEENGLIFAIYEWYVNGVDKNITIDKSKPWAANKNKYRDGWPPETCSTGWAACEMLKAWDLLRKNGIDRPDYKRFAVRILDFFCKNYSEEFGFGKSWTFDGECINKIGTIGAFVTMALCEGYRILGEKKYLDCAAKSLEFYIKRDINNFVCTAGALDCDGIDKETSAPIIIAALDLYEFTKDEKFLEYAEKASYYFASWMHTYDIYQEEDTEFKEYGYSPCGSTYVSVQHPALDQYGELMVSEFLRLYDFTGKEVWKKRAIMMWYNSTQCITDETKNRVFHGIERPVGAQSEAFFIARWGHRKNCNERGHITGWMPSWANVYRLNVIDRITRVNGYKDTSILE